MLGSSKPHAGPKTGLEKTWPVPGEARGRFPRLRTGAPGGYKDPANLAALPGCRRSASRPDSTTTASSGSGRRGTRIPYRGRGGLRKIRGTLQYRIRWVGWPNLAWEPWYFINTTEAVTRFHKRYPKKPGPMPEGSDVVELQRRGSNISGFAGAQSLGGGCCHGSPRGDDKPPATTPATTHSTSPSTPATTPATTHATHATTHDTPTTTLPTVAIGKHGPFFDAHSVQDLEVLATSGHPNACVHGATVERCEPTGGSLARGVSGLGPGTERGGAMRS